MVEMLQADSELADIYLAAALEVAGLPGGQFALETAQRQIVKAQGVATVDQLRVRSGF